MANLGGDEQTSGPKAFTNASVHGTSELAPFRSDRTGLFSALILVEEVRDEFAGSEVSATALHFECWFVGNDFDGAETAVGLEVGGMIPHGVLAA